jgi:hypothetical protein
LGEEKKIDADIQERMSNTSFPPNLPDELPSNLLEGFVLPENMTLPPGIVLNGTDGSLFEPSGIADSTGEDFSISPVVNATPYFFPEPLVYYKKVSALDYRTDPPPLQEAGL